ncbi:MAG: phosphomannomutase [Pseudomonadota bacterium]
MTSIDCFKAYDIRGRLPDQLNDDIAYRIGRAYASFLRPRRVVVGHDIRLSSPTLTEALTRGLLEEGVDVLHIGQVGTEEIYFATDNLGLDGGICVTASHNPRDYNGMKLVKAGARPISGDTGLRDIQTLAERNEFGAPERRGTLRHGSNRKAYVDHLLGYVDRGALQRLRIVVNAGNGGAGAVIDALEDALPFTFVKVHHEPDGNFPNGIPNPLLEDNRAPTIEAVREHGADLGLAWDGDFDRCFFFDATGRFIEGYYLVGLLAEAFLQRSPDERIVHDPRLCWNTRAVVSELGGTPIQSKTGHAFIKERMRAEDAIYGGEMSAHHYFRDFAYCDSGMIPWLLVTGLMSRSGQTLAALVDAAIERFPCSGEINRVVTDPRQVIDQVTNRYGNAALEVDHTDGISMEFEDWRFNLRMSNTEPVLRLNVESRADMALMAEKRDDLIALMEA